MTDRPQGTVKVIKAELTQEPRHAVYVRVIFEDEAGKQWSAKYSSFLFDLKPFEQEAS